MMLKIINKTGKALFDRIGSEKLRTSILQALPFWVASLITGLIAVAYSRLFALAEQGTSYIFSRNHYIFYIITPCCFVISYWVVKKFSPYAKGSGIPQVMAAIELSSPSSNDKTKSLLGIRVIIIKIFSSILMVFGGGVVGREGPTIQIAASVFRKTNQWLPAWWPKISKKNMIMTGAAAGLAAAFNTPLGGIVFAVEELTKTHISFFKTALFSAIIIAGLTAQGFLGPYLYLGYPDVRNLSGLIYFTVILVAVIGGLFGSIISKLILMMIRWKRNFKKVFQHYLYVIVCALIIVSIAIFISQSVFGSGKDLMTRVLFSNEKYSGWSVAILRMTGPLLSFTTGAAGGIFAPSLSAGAAIGSVLSGWFHLSPTNSNLIILAGMVAFLTGVTRTPFTSAILVLEMTDRHNVIFHLMLAGMIASIVALLIDKNSLYDHLREEYINDMHNLHQKKKRAELEQQQFKLQ